MHQPCSPNQTLKHANTGTAQALQGGGGASSKALGGARLWVEAGSIWDFVSDSLVQNHKVPHSASTDSKP